MRYLHTMVRVTDLDQSLDFFCNKLGLEGGPPLREREGPLHADLPRRAGGQGNVGVTKQAPLVELTYNWDPEDYTGGRNFGHLAYEVDDIYATCQRLMDNGVTINRPPRDGNMAFVKSPDGISIELLQKGDRAKGKRAVGLDAEHRQLVGDASRSGSRRCATSARRW